MTLPALVPPVQHASRGLTEGLRLFQLRNDSESESRWGATGTEGRCQPESEAAAHGATVSGPNTAAAQRVSLRPEPHCQPDSGVSGPGPRHKHGRLSLTQ